METRTTRNARREGGSMKLRGLALLVAGAAFFTWMPMDEAGAQEKIRWKVQSTFNTGWPALGDPIAYVSKMLRNATDGRIQLKVYEPGKIVPPLEISPSISRGDLPAAYNYLAYDQGRIPAAVLFSAVPFGMEPWEYAAWWFGRRGRLSRRGHLPPAQHPSASVQHHRAGNRRLVPETDRVSRRPEGVEDPFLGTRRHGAERDRRFRDTDGGWRDLRGIGEGDAGRHRIFDAGHRRGARFPQDRQVQPLPRLASGVHIDPSLDQSGRVEQTLLRRPDALRDGLHRGGPCAPSPPERRCKGRRS